MNVSAGEAENMRLLSEVLGEIGSGVFERSVFIDSFVAKEDVDESERKRAMRKAKQQSLKRMGSLFKMMNQSSGDASSPMQGGQLMAKHKEELRKWRRRSRISKPLT